MLRALSTPSSTARKLSATLLALLLPVLAYNACGQSPDKSHSKATNLPLTITPSIATISSGEQLQTSVSGGTPPYHFVKQTGQGSVTTDGKFVSTAIVGQPTGYQTYTTVGVVDSLGATAYMTVTVIEGAYVTLPPDSQGMKLFSTPYPMIGAGQVTLTASGGKDPYTFTVITGVGTIAKNILTVPNATQIVVVRLTDATGKSADYALSMKAQ